MRSISARAAPSRGCSQIKLASMLTMRPGTVPIDGAQQIDRVRTLPPLLLGREERADVAPARGAEQRVDHRVGEDVGVGVAGQTALVLDLDPAEDQASTLGEAVAVVADPDAHLSNPRRPRHRAARAGAGAPRRRQISPTPERVEKLDRPLVAEADLLGQVGVGGEREAAPRLDAHLGELRRRIDLANRLAQSRGRDLHRDPLSTIASIAGS